MAKYFTKEHSKFLIKIHVIFCVKYRKKLLVRYGGVMKSILLGVAARSDFLIEVLEVDQDHVHMLISYPPTLSVTSIVRRLKQMSTYSIWQMYPNYLAKEFWKEHTFWSDGYFACSTGDASTATVRKYIEQQG